jgi:hypothetical protein
MPFDLIQHPLAFELPPTAYSNSAWLAHIPLTPILVALVRPQVLVELGTHAGDSYLAFCRAVQGLKMPARCTAVDTWKGDPQASFYGPEVLQRLRELHDAPFGAFSRLMQCTFDEARPAFAEGSVDLLHIDGMHEYESVRHDFETWLPTVSPRGIVIFHDTTERGATFGVYRFWDEVAGRYPSYNLPYGHGLGLLAVGPNVEPAFLEFLEDLRRRPELVRILERLGHHLDVPFRRTWACMEGVVAVRAAINGWRARAGLPVAQPTPSIEQVDAAFHQEVGALFRAALQAATTPQTQAQPAFTTPGNGPLVVRFGR